MVCLVLSATLSVGTLVLVFGGPSGATTSIHGSTAVPKAATEEQQSAPASAISQVNSQLYVATPANGGDDSNPCTSALPCATLGAAANLAASGATISIGPGTFNGGSSISVSGVTIVGSGTGQTILDDSNNFVVVVQSGAIASISGLTITDGAILAEGTTTVSDAVFSNISGTEGGIEDGSGSTTVSDTTFNGGYFTNNTGASTLSDSTLSSSSDIQNTGAGTFTVTNSTFSDSTVQGFAGTTVVSNSTLVDSAGAVLSEQGGAVTIDGSIVDGSCSGSITDGGYNLDDHDSPPNSCGFSTGAHDVVEENPLLGALANNGGSTETFTITPSSPAFEGIPAASCPATDQLGTTRPQPSTSSACDIGAYEWTGIFGSSHTYSTNGALTTPAPGLLAGAADTTASPILHAQLVSGPAHGTISIAPDGSFIYTPFAGFGGSDSFTYDVTDQHSTVSSPATVTITVIGTPILSWAAPAAITDTIKLSATQLDATSSVPGTFVYSPPAGTTLVAGSHTLSALFTPSDPAAYVSASTSVSITVDASSPPPSQSVLFASTPPSPSRYGGSYTPAATIAPPTSATPGFSIDAASTAGTCRLSGGVVAFTGIGSCVIDASAPGSGGLLTATAKQVIPVNAAPLEVSSPSGTLTYGSAAPSGTATYSGFVNGDSVTSIPVGAICSTTVGPTSPVGSYPSTCSGVVDSNYAVTYAPGSYSVTPAPTTVTWATPSAITFGDPLSPTQLDASSSVAGSFLYSPAAGSKPGAGNDTLTATFTPTDSADFAPSSGSVSLSVKKATPAITWPSPQAVVYGSSLMAVQLDATSSVPGTFVYTPPLGTAVIAGSEILTATFTPHDTDDDVTGTTKTTTLQVNPAVPSITWTAPQPITPGTALSSTQLDASSSAPGTFAYSPPSGDVPGVGTTILSATFTPTDPTKYAKATDTVNLDISATATPTSTTTPGGGTTPSAPPTTAVPAGSTGTAVVGPSVTSTTLPAPPDGLVSINIDGAPGIAITKGRVEVSGHDFLPGTTVSIIAHSTPVTLASAPVGSDGAFSASVGLPSGLGAGAHHIIVSGTLKNGNVVAQEEAFSVATGDVLGSVGTLPPGPLQDDVAFIPSAHKAAVLATAAGATVAIGAVAASLGGGMAGGRGGSTPRGGSSSGGGDGGYLEDAELEREEAEESGDGDGDRSWIGHLPGTHHVDRHSRLLPARLAAISPVIGRVAVDGDYLRALIGSAWLMLCAAAVGLGLYASASTGWYAVPPTLGIFLAVLGLSIFDSTLGYLAGASFFASALVARHITTAPEIRLGAGLVLIWFTIPLAAAALRPLRRTISLTLVGIWDRLADVVIGGLFAAWASEKMLGALSGLAGVELPIEKHVNAIAAGVLLFVFVRIVIETIVVHHFPKRLETVTNEGELESENLQVGLSLIIQIVLFCFISISYLGSTWGLYVGTAVFFSPLIPWLFANKIPKSAFVTKWKPSGLLNWTLIIVFGIVLSQVLGHFVHSDSLVETLGFIILPLPILVSWALELFEQEEGQEEHEAPGSANAPDSPPVHGPGELVLVGSSPTVEIDDLGATHEHHFAGVNWSGESARSAFRDLDAERLEHTEEAKQATLPTWRLMLVRCAGIPLIVACVYLVVTHIAGN